MAIYTLHLFAGAGGGILADMLLGHRPIGAVEIEPFARQVLLRRQLDGSLPRFPVWDDILTFSGSTPGCKSYFKRLRATRDELCISGGFPCQDISSAGRGNGMEGEKSGLWKEMERVVRKVGPRYVFVENSDRLTRRGLDRVLMDLAKMGYNAVWGVLGADDAGAPHIRKRIWILAYAQFGGRQANGGCNALEGTPEAKSIGRHSFAIPSSRSRSNVDNTLCGRYRDSEGEICPGRNGVITTSRATPWDDGQLITGADGTTRLIKPGLLPLAYGVAGRLDKLKAIGNGQVPIVAATAFRILINQLNHHP